jgi:hypothetical protein
MDDMTMLTARISARAIHSFSEVVRLRFLFLRVVLAIDYYPLPVNCRHYSIVFGR